MSPNRQTANASCIQDPVNEFKKGIKHDLVPSLNLRRQAM